MIKVVKIIDCVLSRFGNKSNSRKYMISIIKQLEINCMYIVCKMFTCEHKMKQI